MVTDQRVRSEAAMFGDFGQQIDRCPACGNEVVFGLDAFAPDAVEALPELVVQAWTCPWCETTHIERFAAEVIAVTRRGHILQREGSRPFVVH
jgi:hypothetical protein